MLVPILTFLSEALHALLGYRGTCRYQPTCSKFCQEAIDEWGVVRGGLLSIKRLLRCHPWGKSGADPVPKVTALRR